MQQALDVDFVQDNQSQIDSAASAFLSFGALEVRFMEGQMPLDYLFCWSFSCPRLDASRPLSPSFGLLAAGIGF